MTYKLDAPLILNGEANPDRHIQIGKWRGPIALDGDIDAQIDALPLTDAEKASAKVEIREGWTTLQARPPEPPPRVLSYIEKRQAEYGSPQEQIENIIENGLAAEQTRIAAIKAKYPKT